MAMAGFKLRNSADLTPKCLDRITDHVLVFQWGGMGIQPLKDGNQTIEPQLVTWSISNTLWSFKALQSGKPAVFVE